MKKGACHLAHEMLLSLVGKISFKVALQEKVLIGLISTSLSGAVY